MVETINFLPLKCSGLLPMKTKGILFMDSAKKTGWRITFLWIICLSMAVFLTGCSTSQNAKDVIEESVKNVQSIASGDPIRVFSFPEIYYNFCITMDRWAAVIIVFSFLAGIILYDIFKKNKEIKKWALSVLIWKVPVFVFVGVYVYSWLYGAFTNYN